MKKKRILLMTLALCLIIIMIPTASFAGMDQEKDVVAMIGNVEYTDLQEAINDVKNGGTIKLVDDVYGGGFDTEKSGMKFTLDLNDNKIINGNEYWITLGISDCNVTIKNGSIVNEVGADPETDEYLNICEAIYVNGKVTLKNVNLSTNGAGGVAIEVASKGVLNMTGCKVEALGGDSDENGAFAEAVFVQEGGYIKASKCEFYALNAQRAVETCSKTILNNCKAKALSYSVMAFEGGNLQIAKGTYKASVSIEKGAKGTINGGYFKDEEIALTVFGNAVIKDGKFYGVENAVYVNGGKVTVHKGYFSASNGKAWASKKNPTKLDKVFKIAKNAKVAQKNWKSGKKSTIKVTSK